MPANWSVQSHNTGSTRSHSYACNNSAELKCHFFTRFRLLNMTPQAKSSVFPLQVLLSRSQSGSVKERLMVQEVKEPPCRIWVVFTANIKHMMVIFGIIQKSNLKHFFEIVEFNLPICFPSGKAAEGGAHMEHRPCSGPVHVWPWLERRRGTRLVTGPCSVYMTAVEWRARRHWRSSECIRDAGWHFLCVL